LGAALNGMSTAAHLLGDTIEAVSYTKDKMAEIYP